MIFFKEKKNKAKEDSLSGMPTLKMVVGKIWSFSMFLKMHISYLVLVSKSSILCGILTVFYVTYI